MVYSSWKRETARAVLKGAMFLGALAAYGQGYRFDVVSIRPAPPGAGGVVSSSGGPRTKSPETWNCRGMSLGNVVRIAFNLPASQLIMPDWLREPRFDITAKVPVGATREQFYEMLQNMLVDRFGMKYHHEPRKLPGYELVVAKSGPKFKESGPEAPRAASPQANSPNGGGAVFAEMGADGYPTPPSSASGVWQIDGRARGQWLRVEISRLVTELVKQLDVPVIDATGLRGLYDMSLYWVTKPDGPGGDGPTILAAVQGQLGLKLNSIKVDASVVIIDHAERIPTEN